MEKSKKLEKLEIVSNRKIPKSNFHLLSFFSPHIALSSKPGQFVEIGLPDSILPKPFCIHNTHEFGVVEVLYQVLGHGTQKLSNMAEGTQITVLGPLGTHFDLPSEGMAYFVGGGTGIAPLLYAQSKMKNSTTFLGGKTKEFLAPSRFNESTHHATDDGSLGFKGTVIDLMSSQLLPAAPVFACGPKPMLKALWNYVKNWNVKVQFSLEEYMACGVGACLGCVCETKNGYKRVCTDGPVFDASEVADGL